jgi:hypothetical protein
LVTSYQFLPSELISTSACQYQLQVTIVHLSRHKAYPQITPIDSEICVICGWYYFSSNITTDFAGIVNISCGP